MNTSDQQVTAPATPRVTIRNEALRPAQQRIALITILGPLLGLIAALIVVGMRGFTRMDFWMLVGGVVLGQLALEVGFHRLLAHRAFDSPRWLRVLLAVGGSMTGQGRVTHWVANHRRHHRHSDTPSDPHSPYVRARRDGPGAQELGLWHGLVHAQWGHMLTDDVPNCTLFAKDMGLDADLRFINRHYVALVWAGLLAPALLGLVISGNGWGALSGFLWGGLVRMLVVQNVTWSVASASHRFGSVRFASGDRSKNLIWTALPSFGSGYQNNHHAFPQSAILGLRWWELDVAGLVIRALAAMHLIRDVRRPTPAEIERRLLRDA